MLIESANVARPRLEEAGGDEKLVVIEKVLRTFDHLRAHNRVAEGTRAPVAIEQELGANR